MKHLALLLASAAFVTPAIAADVIYEEPMAPAPVVEAVAFEPASTWTGLYVGGQAGVAFNNDAADFFGDSDDDDFDDSSFVGGSEDGDSAFIGGVHIGYDHQINSLIIGAVADINYIDAESSSSFTVPTDIDGEFETFGSTQEINFVGTARGKLGVALDRFAVYATGGLAYADVENQVFGDGATFTNEDGTFNVSAEEDSDDFGYAVGGGVDYLVTDNLSLGVEYLYHDLGSSEVEFTYTDVAGDETLDFTSSSNDDLDFHTVWAKASFRFN